MNLKEHIDSFEELYARLEDLNLANVCFPLEDIEAFRWNRGQWRDGYYSYHYRRFTAHLLSRLQLADRQSILVVGCGFGMDEKNLRRLCPNSDLWSVDISRNMLRLAIAGKSPSRFAVALAERLPFPDASFDRVLSREVIEHVMDPQAMLSEIHRVLRPGGVAVVTTENDESYGPTNFFDGTVAPAIARLFGQPMPAKVYKDEAPPLEEMKAMASAASLEITEVLFDGAAYKYLIELSPLLKERLVRAAHIASCLENSPMLAPLFCDQVKYVLRKPGSVGGAWSPPGFACPRCKRALRQVSGGAFTCTACAVTYPAFEGVPDFSLRDRSETNITPSNETLDVFQSKARRVMARAAAWLTRVLRAAYSTGYVLAALLASFLVPKNRGPLSRLLREDDPYQRYLKL
jgi:ubiquinone/menaquinone biosynthesis C-methylase UbiE